MKTLATLQTWFTTFFMQQNQSAMHQRLKAQGLNLDDLGESSFTKFNIIRLKSSIKNRPHKVSLTNSSSLNRVPLSWALNRNGLDEFS